MSTKAQAWAESYFNRLETAIQALNQHDLVNHVSFLKFSPVSDEEISDLEERISDGQTINCSIYKTDKPEGPFTFNEYIKAFYKQSNGLHVSWHSIIFPETEIKSNPEDSFPIAEDQDDFFEGWLSLLPLRGLASPIGFNLYRDPHATTFGKNAERGGAVFNYIDGYNYYYDACIVLKNENPTIVFGNDHSASYDTPHACDFVIYMEYVLSTFFSVACRSEKLYFDEPSTVYPELDKMVKTQDYSGLQSLLKNNSHTDINSVISLGYEEKGHQYADEDYLEQLPEAVKERLIPILGDN